MLATLQEKWNGARRLACTAIEGNLVDMRDGSGARFGRRQWLGVAILLRIAARHGVDEHAERWLDADLHACRVDLGGHEDLHDLVEIAAQKLSRLPDEQNSRTRRFDPLEIG